MRGSSVIWLCACSGNQIILMTVPIKEEHKRVCPQLEPQSAVRTSLGFTSQQKMGQHKFQGYYIPANSPTSRSALLYVLECFAVRATNKSKRLIPAQSPEWRRLVLRQGTFPSRGALLEISFQLFVTRPNLCLQF